MEQTTCAICDKAFTPHRASQRFCSSACYGESKKRGPKRDGVEHRTTLAVGHPIAPPSGRVAVARLVLFDAIGPGAHPCNWCGMDVRWEAARYAADALVVDHLDHDPTNDALENLAPSCNSCNAHRRGNGKSNRITDSDLTTVWSGRKVRAHELTCERCGRTFLRPLSVTARFCSIDCRWCR